MEKQLIFEALANINKKVEPIKKEKKNAQQGFMYRGIDQVMNDLHNYFAEEGVLITSDVINAVREERTTKSGGSMNHSVIDYKFTFHASDGSSVSSTARGEAMDSGDKGSNKCISVALKYVLFNMFLIPTEEMKDPDAETPEATMPKTQAQAPADPAQNQQAPATPVFTKGIAKSIDDAADYPALNAIWKQHKELQSDPKFVKHINARKDAISGAPAQ